MAVRFDAGLLGCGCKQLCGMHGFYSASRSQEESDKIMTKSLVGGLRVFAGKLDVNLVMFGDGVKQKNGQTFADFLVRKGLGTVQPSEVVTSPVHPEKGHEGFQAWFWYVDRAAVEELYKETIANEPPMPPEQVNQWGGRYYDQPRPHIPPPGFRVE